MTSGPEMLLPSAATFISVCLDQRQSNPDLALVQTELIQARGKVLTQSAEAERSR